MTPSIAVILFPGTNCELETIRAVKRAGMKPELFRWNRSRRRLKNYDGYIIAGGFSYEDRGRSGIIASKDPIMDTIRQEAENGKPVLGICNGAQILVETGMIPGLTDGLEMSLTWNTRIRKGKLLGIGYYNDWFHMRSDARKGRSIFNHFSKDTILKAPIASGEGRFITKEKKLLEKLIENEQTLFRFCDEEGNIEDNFPNNPNGSIYNLAGVCNKEGNVLALMPHPERHPAEGQPLFDSIAYHLTKNPKIIIPKPEKPIKVHPYKEKITKHVDPDIIISVRLIITDNEERTLENTMKNKGFKNLKLKRYIYYTISTKNKDNLKKVAEKLIKSGELLNLNKEIPTVIIDGVKYEYDKTSGLAEKEPREEKWFKYHVSEYDNFAGKSLLKKIESHFPENEVTKIEKSILWRIKLKKQDSVDKLINTHIFHNPHAAKIVAHQ